MCKIALYDKKNICDLAVPDNGDARYAYNFLKPMLENGVDKYIKNISTELMILQIDDILLPVAICENQYDNSYTSSLYCHYVSYSKEELYELKNSVLEFIFKIMLNMLGMMLKLGKSDKAVYVNNWFLSTNLHLDITAEQYHKITEYLKEKFPKHAIVVRSLNDRQHKRDLKILQNEGYGLLGSRQVYIFDRHKRTQLSGKIKNKLEKDIRLLDRSPMKISNVGEGNIQEIENLYNQLYLEQYSYHNPQFTNEFYRLCIQNNLMTFRAFFDHDKLKAILGYYSRNGTMTTPIFGYDLSLPKETGMYRMMSAKLVLESEQNGFILNCSSGASKFKLWRGSEPAIEYSAILYKHLPFIRKCCYRILGCLINGIAIKLIKKFGL